MIMWKCSIPLKKRAIRHMVGFVVQKIQKKFKTDDAEMLIESDKATIMDANSTGWINIID